MVKTDGGWDNGNVLLVVCMVLVGEILMGTVVAVVIIIVIDIRVMIESL